MASGPTQALLPLVGLAAEKVIRDPYKTRFSCRKTFLSNRPPKTSRIPRN
ncbi:MAG: hypothetical protein ACQESR_05390 [Planctomycetota bacterium]